MNQDVLVTALAVLALGAVAWRVSRFVRPAKRGEAPTCPNCAGHESKAGGAPVAR